MKRTGLLFVLLLTCASVMLAAPVLQTNLALKYIARGPRVKSSHPPVFILLHGVGSNEQDLFSLAEQLPTEALVISARAPIALSKDGYGWYHLNFGDGVPKNDPAEAEISRKLILTFIEQVVKQYNADAKRVYLLGFSQGAIMSEYVALTAPQKVKGIIALSGRLLDEVPPKAAAKDKLKELSVFIAHGTNDKVLDVKYGRAANKYFTAQDINTTYKEYNMGHEISASEMADIKQWLLKN
ncbi:MAG: esterase [Taibaiella sp.]|nr:esterase [Taibaiella sp.]